MERKNIKFQIKAFNEETGEFEGIASAYRKTPDKVKDIADPGAYTKTIKENDEGIMLTYPPHIIESIVGKGILSDTAEGLLVKGTILRGIQKGEEAYILMKNGIIKTLSIGYEVVKKEMKNGIRHLKEVKLYEIGLVPGKLAADDQAIIHSFKAMDFNEALSQQNIMNQMWKLINTFENVVLEILRDEEEEDKPAALQEAAEQFYNAFGGWASNADLKSLKLDGGTLAPENVKQIQCVISSLQTMLGSENKNIPPESDDDNDSTSDDTEPSLDTQEDKEAAEVEGVIARFSNNLKAHEIGNKIDQIIKNLKEK